MGICATSVVAGLSRVILFSLPDESRSLPGKALIDARNALAEMPALIDAWMIATLPNRNEFPARIALHSLWKHATELRPLLRGDAGRFGIMTNKTHGLAIDSRLPSSPPEGAN